eukprot:scaffold2209_cov168-Amphora_coffeaeformis.AAC.10
MSAGLPWLTDTNEERCLCVHILSTLRPTLFDAIVNAQYIDPRARDFTGGTIGYLSLNVDLFCPISVPVLP